MPEDVSVLLSFLVFVFWFLCFLFFIIIVVPFTYILQTLESDQIIITRSGKNHLQRMNTSRLRCHAFVTQITETRR